MTPDPTSTIARQRMEQWMLGFFGAHEVERSIRAEFGEVHDSMRSDIEVGIRILLAADAHREALPYHFQDHLAAFACGDQSAWIRDSSGFWLTHSVENLIGCAHRIVVLLLQLFNSSEGFMGWAASLALLVNIRERTDLPPTDHFIEFLQELASAAEHHPEFDDADQRSRNRRVLLLAMTLLSRGEDQAEVREETVRNLAADMMAFQSTYGVAHTAPSSDFLFDGMGYCDAKAWHTTLLDHNWPEAAALFAPAT